MVARPSRLTRERNARLRLIPIAMVFVIAAGCGGDDDDGAAATSVAGAGSTVAPGTSASESDASVAPAASGDLTIFADQSLADAFTDIALAFESEYEDVVPHTTFDASNLLVGQIVDGTPADVFASADAADMDTLTEADLSGSEPVVFATDAMTIIVPVGNPADVTGVDDLGAVDLRVALCAEETACGRDAQRVLDAAGVTVTASSTAETTDELVELVENGTADAAIVYSTDMTFSGDADRVEIPPDLNVLVEYSVAVVSTSPNASTAQAFVDFVAGPAGQQVLEQYNFGPP